MADPITWGLINLVKKGVKGVQTTLDAFEVTIDELKKNVEDTLSDVQETVEKSPAGLPPSGLEGFTAMSKEEGIEVVYTANAIRNSSGENTSNDAGLIYDSMTKGVMIRYSKDQYPTNIDEGELAVIDEDIYTIDELGARKVKTKKFTIVGLTNNLKYYISAFPYSYNNVYNISSGSENGAVQKRNRVTCQWTGTKGTLTVNVTQDYDYKPLGEYTATLTPTAGGEAITKTQSGAGTVVFSGLEAGEYTLSFGNSQSFIAPPSKQIKVISGQSISTNASYSLSGSIGDYSWEELVSMCRDGVAKSILQIGTKKTTATKVQNGTNLLDFSSNASPSLTDAQTEVMLIGMNVTNNANPSNIYDLSFVTCTPIIKNALIYGTGGGSTEENANIFNRWRDGGDAYLRNFLNNNRETLFPEIYQYMIPVKNKTSYKQLNNNQVHETTDYIYVLSAHNVNSGVNSPDDSSEEILTFPYFTNKESRAFLSKTANDSDSKESYLRSTYIPFSTTASEKLSVMSVFRDPTTQTEGSVHGTNIGNARGGAIHVVFTLG